MQQDNASAPLLWKGDHGGEGRLLVGSDPLELWEWTLAPGDERSSGAHRTNSREVLLVTDGTVTVTVGAAEPVCVCAGQSALFRADEPHSLDAPHHHWARRAAEQLAQILTDACLRTIGATNEGDEEEAAC